MTGIFRAYDIRGAYPAELDEMIAEKIGIAFARLMNRGVIALGRDCRLSSPALAAAFVRGCTGEGGAITDFGMISSPLLYYATIRGMFDGGAMITASHLPPATNGIKLSRELAIPLSGDQGLPALQRMVEAMPGGVQTVQAAGAYKMGNLMDEYLDMVAGSIHNPLPLRIAIDAGDGMAGPEIPQLFARLPLLEPVAIHIEPDGRFPHHGPNPFISSGTDELEALVRKSKADFGVAFDGDADRCIFVDEKGERIPADLVIALIADFYLAQSPGATILYDLRSSRVVAETIARLGGRAVRSRVGHAFIKEKMRQENALFAGELSGHYYFKDTGFCDSGIFAMAQMVNFLSWKNMPLSQLIAPLRKYASTGEINLRTGRHESIMAALRAAFPDAGTDTLDGLTIQYPDWWFNLRPSNTEPVARLNLEARTEAGRNQRLEEVLQVIHKTDPTVEIEKS